MVSAIRPFTLSPFPTKNLSVIEDNFDDYPGVPGLFPLERRMLNHLAWFNTIIVNNPLLPIYLSLGYALSILVIGKWMAQREAFRLRGPLLLWNTFLAVFSIAGTVRVWPELVFMLKRGGFRASSCSDEYIDVSGRMQ